MTAILVLAALWKCSAIDPTSGRVYYAQAADKLRAQKAAVSRCEFGDPFGPPTTCFVKRCEQVGGPTPAPAPSPTPACTCNPAHTVCTCEIDPNDPGAEMWIKR